MAPPISPSQISDFAPEYGGCERYWGFIKIRKVPKPPNPHAQWGTELHRQAELWLRDAAPPDAATPQGKALLRAIEAELLPAPRTVEVETPIAFSLEGVDFHGRRDFGKQSYDAGLGTGHDLIGDHKTTGSIRRAREGGYMMTPAKMRADPQFLIYGYASIVESFPAQITGRWIYYPRDKGKPEAVESSESCNHIEDEMHERILPIAHRIVKAYSEPLEARPRNLKACGRYSGCPFKGICLPGISPAKRLVSMTSKNDTESPLDSVRSSSGGSALERLKAKMAARKPAANDAPAEPEKAEPPHPPPSDPTPAEIPDPPQAPEKAEPDPPEEAKAEPKSAKKLPPTNKPGAEKTEPTEKPKRKRGRPKGSKNKPKTPEPEPVEEAPIELGDDRSVDSSTLAGVSFIKGDMDLGPMTTYFADHRSGLSAEAEILTRLHVAAIAAHQPPEVANTHYAAILDKLEGN